MEMDARLALGDCLRLQGRPGEAREQYERVACFARLLCPPDPTQQAGALLRTGLCWQAVLKRLQGRNTERLSQAELARQIAHSSQRAFAVYSDAEGLLDSIRAPAQRRAQVQHQLAVLCARSGNSQQAAQYHDKEADLLREGGDESGAEKAAEAAE